MHTEDTYLSTIRRFIVFHGRRHPASLGPEAVRDYLTHLAVEEHVAATLLSSPSLLLARSFSYPSRFGRGGEERAGVGTP
jgi:hypothetical protein